MMKATFSRTWQLYRRHFGGMMMLLLIELILRLMVCVPLLFLASSQTKWLALLCLPLFVLIVLPARANTAEVFSALEMTDSLNLKGLVSFENYGRKVVQGLKRTGLLLLWGLPFLVVTAAAMYLYKAEAIPGVTDTFTLLQKVLNLGRSGFAEFLLGGISSITVRGVVMVILMYLLTLLPLLIGFGFHSGARHEEALCDHSKVIRGHRGGILGTWILGLLTLLPFILAAWFICADYVNQVLESLSNLGLTSLSLPPIDSRAWLLGASVVVLLLPVIPFKQLLISSRVNLLQEKNHEHVAGGNA